MQGGITSLIPHQITPDSSEVGSNKSGSTHPSPAHTTDDKTSKDSLISLLDDSSKRVTKDVTFPNSASSKFTMERASSLDIQTGHSSSNAATTLPHSNSLDLDSKPNVKDLLGEQLQALSTELTVSSSEKNQNVLEAEMLKPEEVTTSPVVESKSNDKDRVEMEEELISLENESSNLSSVSVDASISKADNGRDGIKTTGNEAKLISLGDEESSSDLASTDVKLNQSGRGQEEAKGHETKIEERLISFGDESSNVDLVSVDLGLNKSGDGQEQAEEGGRKGVDDEEEESVMEGEEDNLKKISAIMDEANEQKELDVYIVDIEVEDEYEDYEDDEDQDDDRFVPEEESSLLTISGEASMPSGMDEEQVAQFEGFFEGVADRIASKNLEKTMGVSAQGLPAETMDGKVSGDGQDDRSSLLVPKESEPRPLTVSGEEVDSLPQCV